MKTQCILCLFICIHLLAPAQIQTGVYYLPEIAYRGKTEAISLEIEKKSDHYYTAIMRTEPKDQRYSYPYAFYYYGAYENGTLSMHLLHHTEIVNEKLSKNRYYPGQKNVSRASGTLSYKQLKITSGNKYINLEPIGPGMRYSSHKFYFDAERSAQAAKIRTIISNDLGVAPQQYFKAQRGEEKIAVLLKWGEQLFYQYPNINPKYLPHKPFISYKTRNSNEPKHDALYYLFSDNAFIPYFGKSFDRLTERERTQIREDINSGFGAKGGYRYTSRPASPYLYLIVWQDDALKRALSPSTRYYDPLCLDKTRKAVQDRRLHKQKYEEFISLLANHNNLSTKELENMRNQVNKKLARLSYIEQEKVLSIINQREEVAAEKELIAAFDELAQAPHTFQTLQQAEKTYNGIRTSKAPSNIRKAQSNRGKELISVVCSKLMEQEQEILSTIVNIDQLAKWYKTFDSRYQNFAGFSNSVNATYDLFFKQKALALSRSQSAFSKEIAACKNETALNRVERKYLHPFQEKEAIYNEYKTKLEERREEIQFYTKPIMGSYTLAEIQKIEAETTETGEPTEAQMRLAICKKMTGVSQRMKDMANTTVNGDLMAGIIKVYGMIGSSASYRISTFEKLGCIPARDKPGYVCDCLIDIRTNAMPGLGGASASTHRYLKTKKYGWTMMENLE